MKIAIYGYGNLGKGVEAAAKVHEDCELIGVFTRRAPETVKTVSGVPVYSIERITEFKDSIDVLILCGGSATDLPVASPQLALDFNIVDSFDTHAKIPDHFDRVNDAATKSCHTALISCGWDPGLFSIARLYSSAVLPDGRDYTFWGKGVSQGHSDAIRRIDGVLDARQYTIPIEDALTAVRSGSEPELSTAEKHRRECFVAVKDGADKALIEEKIKTMPNYFADYETKVHFVTLDELKTNHSALPHGGSVIRSGKTGINEKNTHTVEFSLRLDSNPEFTASVLVAYARAIHRMSLRKDYGCKTVFDIAPRDISPLSAEELRAKLL